MLSLIIKQALQSPIIVEVTVWERIVYLVEDEMNQ